MKKNYIICLKAAMFMLLLVTSSCATLFNKNPVVLYGYTNDLKVRENGGNLPVKLTYVGTKGLSGYNNSKEYFGAGVELDPKQKTHTLELERDGKTAQVTLKSKSSGKYIFLNLFTSGPLGIMIDAATKKGRVSSPNWVDVSGELGEAPKQSKAKLKKQFKKAVDKKYASK